jgi:hypothetical protein
MHGSDSTPSRPRSQAHPSRSSWVGFRARPDRQILCRATQDLGSGRLDCLDCASGVARRELSILLRGGTVLVRCLLIAVGRSLVAVGRGLVEVGLHLVDARERLLAIGQRLIVVEPAGGVAVRRIRRTIG